MGYKVKDNVSAQFLATELGLDLLGVDRTIKGVSPYHSAGHIDLTFTKVISRPKINGTVITSDPEVQHKSNGDTAYLLSTNPRLDFIRALEYLDRSVGFVQPDFESRIHRSVVVGRNVVIEKGCDIAEGVELGHNVVVRSGSVIGKDSVIRPGAVIGGEGFGFSRLEDGAPLRFIHLGGVRIGRNVEIGENTSICRGTLDDTIVEANAKIDNLVHLAHNCHVKEGAFIIACAEISGGVTIGRNAWVGPNASIIEKVTIGDDALIGIGSVVISDVPERSVYVGNPAKFLKAIP